MPKKTKKNPGKGKGFWKTKKFSDQVKAKKQKVREKARREKQVRELKERSRRRRGM